MNVIYYAIIGDATGKPPDPEVDIRLSITSASGYVLVENGQLSRNNVSRVSFECTPGANVTLTIDGAPYSFVVPKVEGVFPLSDVVAHPAIRASIDPLIEETPEGPMPVSDATIWLTDPYVVGMEY